MLRTSAFFCAEFSRKWFGNSRVRQSASTFKFSHYNADQSRSSLASIPSPPWPPLENRFLQDCRNFNAYRLPPPPSHITMGRRLGNFLRFVAGRMVVVGANNRSISTTISSCYNGKNRRISRSIFRKNSTQFFALLHSVYAFFCRARSFLNRVQIIRKKTKKKKKKDNRKTYASNISTHIFKNRGRGEK